MAEISPIPSNLEEFGEQASSIKPRIFDRYILPAFLLIYAYKSKSPMGRTARRMLFTAGVYMIYRNWKEYSQIVKTVANLQENSEPSEPVELVEPEGETA